MKRTIIFLALFFIAVSWQYGIISNSAFTLGTFSYVSNKNMFYSNCDQFNQYMEDLGYNTSLFELYPSQEGGTSNLLYLFTSLRNHKIKAAIWDADYIPGNRNSSYAYSTACYQRFEAEFCDWHSVYNDSLDSQFWYGSRDVRIDSNDDGIWDTYHKRVGKTEHYSTASYEYRWACYQDSIPSVGYAYADLNYRWIKTPYSGSENDTLDIRVGQEFALKKLTQSILGPAPDQYLYLSYRFKIEEIRSIPDNVPLLQFTICGYPYSGGGHSKTPKFVDIYVNGNNMGLNYNLTYADYQYLHNLDPNNEWVTLNVAVRYCDLWEKQLLVSENWWRNTLVNINPRVYWFHNCDLFLDYIEIKDDLYNDVQNNATAYNTAMINRISDLQNIQTSIDGTKLVSHIFSYDEPYPPQFFQYRELERNLSLSLRPEKQFTAVNIRNFRLFPMGQNGTKYYNNVEAFTQVARPKNLMVNPYPITPEIKWGSEVTDENHIQKILDEFVLDNYAIAKTYADSLDNREFYACVQAYGDWTDGHWSNYLLPPYETQTMMQYLPLCYGTDGVFNYRLFGFENHDPIGYAALTCDLDITHISNNTFTYQALLNANKKVLTYGPVLRNLNWKGANTILENSVSTPVSLSLLHLDDIHSASTPINDYGCYVQSGYFLDDLGNPSLMLVNRRANRFVSSNYSPAEVPHNEIGNCFPPFNNQDISITIASSANAVYGDCVGFYDAFDESVYLSNNDEVIVTLRAGDGKHLQMCGTLPEVVSENTTFNNFTVLQGEINITNGACVTLNAGCNTRITHGTTITLLNGSSLTLNGDTSIGDEVTINVQDGSSLNINNANCTWGTNSGIKVFGSSLNVNNSKWNWDQAETWMGVEASESSSLIFTDSSIKNAHAISVRNSNFTMFNCSVYVPSDGYGLDLENTAEGYSTNIEASQNNKGFFNTTIGQSDESHGISIGIMKNPVIIERIRFQGLFMGLVVSSQQQITITDCTYYDCKTGVQMVNVTSSSSVEQCTFSSCDKGIHLQAAVPFIDQCIFQNGTLLGILAETSIFTFGQQSGICNSHFIECISSIVSRNSNLSVKGNQFSGNNMAILSHSASNLKLSSDAFNIFQNNGVNLGFMDTEPYISTIQLVKGHNDFYRNEHTNDFSFDETTITSRFMMIPPYLQTAIGFRIIG